MKSVVEKGIELVTKYDLVPGELAREVGRESGFPRIATRLERAIKTGSDLRLTPTQDKQMFRAMQNTERACKQAVRAALRA